MAQKTIISNVSISSACSGFIYWPKNYWRIYRQQEYCHFYHLAELSTENSIISVDLMENIYQ